MAYGMFNSNMDAALFHKIITDVADSKYKSFSALFGCIPPNYLLFHLAADGGQLTLGDKMSIELKMFIYLISPVAFGTKYRNSLLSRCAEYVGLGRNSFFDPTTHSAAKELEVFEVIAHIQKSKVFLQKLPHYLVLSAVRNLDTVLNLKEPKAVLQFAREKYALLVGKDKTNWCFNDENVFLFLVTLLLVFHEEFRRDALEKFPLCMAHNVFEAALALESAARSERNGDFAASLNLCNQALKLNPLCDTIYNRLSQLYCKDGKYEFGRWYAVRSIWLLPYESKNHLQWLRAVEMIPEMVLNAHWVIQALIDFGKVWTTFLNDETQKQAEILEERIQRKVFTSLIADMDHLEYFLAVPSNRPATDCMESIKLHKKNEIGAASELKCQAGQPDGKFVSKVLMQLYGFVPLPWIHLFPRFAQFKGFPNQQFQLAHHDVMVYIISPFAFGVNYQHSILARCAEHFNLVKRESFLGTANSLDDEMEILNLVNITQGFFVAIALSLYTVDKEELARVLLMSDPRQVIEFGKALVFRAFDKPSHWVDNEKIVFLYLLCVMGLNIELVTEEASYAYGVQSSPKEYCLITERAKDFTKRKNYIEALALYKRALQIDPRNAVMFGNIAQVYLCLKDYEAARRCALRSIMLCPVLPKNHYRWLKATELMGKMDEAYMMSYAIKTCFEIGCFFEEQENCKELRAFCDRLCLKAGNIATDKSQTPKHSNAKMQASKEHDGVPLLSDGDKPNLPSNNDKPKLPSNNDKPVLPSNNDKSELPLNNDNPNFTLPRGDSDSNKCLKNKAKVAPKVVTKNKQIVSSCEESEASKQTKNFASISQTLQKYMHDGSEFLVKSVYKSAVENFTMAVQLLRSNGAEPLGLSDIDVVLLKYCYGMACIERRTHEHIRISVQIFEEIINQDNLSFPMAYYGKGLAFFRLNKFLEAVIPLEKCLEITNKLVYFEAHLYPGLPGEVIGESYRDNLKQRVEGLISICHNPPSPDAICFNSECALTSKIYCNDIEFLGYSRLTCRDRCRIEFHPVCWKEFMAENKFHGDKDVLGRPCSTPDCKSLIAKLELVGPDSLVRKMLTETVDSKPKQPNLSKAKNRQMQKDAVKQISKRRDRTDSACSNKSDLLEERRSTSVEKEQVDTIAVSNPDTRNVENALLILKKTDSDQSRLKQPTKKVVCHTEKKNKAFRQFMIQYADRERISALQMQRDLAEMTSNRFCPVQLDSDFPFAIPSQEAASNPFRFEAYLRRLEAANVTPEEVCNVSEMNTHECRDLKCDILEYVEQYVLANGPVSITSPIFLDEINSFPTEVQELMSASGGIRDFMATSRLLFIGDIALMRENLKEVVAGSSLLCSLDLAVGCIAKKQLAITGSRPKRCISTSILLESVVSHCSVYSAEIDGSECCRSSRRNSLTNADEDQESKSSNEDQESKSSNEDHSCNDREYILEKNRLLEELQSYKDKLFSIQKENSVKMKRFKEQLDEVHENNKVAQKKIKELESERTVLTKKLATEKQTAEEQIITLQTKISAQEENTGVILMSELQKVDEERRRRIKLEDDVNTLMKTLKAMESNHDSLVQENRELKVQLSSLELDLTKEQERFALAAAAAKETNLLNVPIQKQPLLQYNPLFYNLNHPYYPSRLGVPLCYPPTRHQLATQCASIRPALSLDNIYIPPNGQGDSTLPLQGKAVQMDPLIPVNPNLNTPPLQPPLVSKAVNETVVDPKFAAASTSTAAQGSNQPKNVRERQMSASSVSSSVSDVGVLSDAVLQVIAGCSMSYAGKAAVRPKIVPKVENQVLVPNFGVSSGYVNRIFECLRKEFPKMQRSEFLTYLQLVRSGNKNSLTGLKLKVIVGRVRKEIQANLPKRERSVPVPLMEKMFSKSELGPPVASGPSFWSEVVGAKTGAKPKKKIGEDVCSICLCDIIECDAHFLQCYARHVFHKKCIREWYYKGEETCPLCRSPAPLHEEFPSLNC